jgi:hypothetical protein
MRTGLRGELRQLLCMTDPMGSSIIPDHGNDPCRRAGNGTAGAQPPESARQR